MTMLLEISHDDLKLSELKEKKNKLIEDVMENETYKKATEILQKFAPNRLNKLNESQSETGTPPSTPNNTTRMAATPGTELRQRNIMNASLGAPSSQAGSPYQAAISRTPGAAVQTPAPFNKITTQQRHLYGAAPGPPLPRQVLPRERPVVERVFEYLVGDGPQNRMALICKVCQSHNGMALAEEFAYLAFRCCYCFHMNDARQRKPDAPRLELDTTRDSDTDAAAGGVGGHETESGEYSDDEEPNGGEPVAEASSDDNSL